MIPGCFAHPRSGWVRGRLGTTPHHASQSCHIRPRRSPHILSPRRNQTIRIREQHPLRLYKLRHVPPPAKSLKVDRPRNRIPGLNLKLGFLELMRHSINDGARIYRVQRHGLNSIRLGDWDYPGGFRGLMGKFYSRG